MATTMDLELLDDGAVQDLARRDDRLGVLSIYAGAWPQDPNLEGLAIDLRNRYGELQRRVGEGPERREVASALERLRPLVTALADPTQSGRGRTVFAALGQEWTLQLNSAMAVSNRVVLDDGPFVHPMLELLDEGRAAGAVLVSPDSAQLLEWRLGRLRPLSRMEQPAAEASHERAGQIGGGPAGQFHTPVREHREARRIDRAERFLGQVVDAVAGLIDERRWDRVLVGGDTRWVETVAAGLPKRHQDAVIRESRILQGADDSVLAAAVTERLHDEHSAQQRRLAEGIHDAAHQGRGALGLSEVLGALNAGRVSHLVYDPAIRYTGSVGGDGALYAGQELGADGSAGQPDPRLTERLVAQALATGARVSPVDGAATGLLREAAGIAALLRW